MIRVNQLWIMLLLGSCALAQTRAAAPAMALQGASMPGWGGDPAAQDRLALDQALRLEIVGSGAAASGKYAVVEIQFQNTSDRPITAHAGKLLGSYADGTERTSGWGQDIAGLTALSRVPDVRLQSPETLNSGETRRLKVSLPPDSQGAPPVYVTGTVTMVIFEDRTALGDAEQIRLMLERRARDSEETAGLLAVMEKARAEPELQEAMDAGRPSEAAALLAKSITRSVNELNEVKPQQEKHARVARRLQLLLDTLKPGARIPGIELRLVDLSILMEQTTQRALAEQSTLKEVK